MGVLTCLVFLITFDLLLGKMEVAGALFMMIIGLFLGLGTWGLIWGGNSLYRTYDEREEVAPHTRPKPEQLPAKEILLRASTEPTEEQEKVLLRAAMTSEDTPPEQLLRPGNAPD